MHKLDTRVKAVVHYVHFQKSIRKVAALYKVPKSTLQRWIHQEIGIRRHDNKTKQVCEVLRDFIQNMVNTNPFVTTHEIAGA